MAAVSVVGSAIAAVLVYRTRQFYKQDIYGKFNTEADEGVFVQVVPLGIEWASRTFFRGPATKMDTVEYLEYQILPQESSLYDEYPKDHPYLRDPKSVNRKGWNATKKVYSGNR
jgi:hypothetical protein